MVLVTLEKFDLILDSQTFSRSGRKTLKDKRLIRNNSSQSGKCEGRKVQGRLQSNPPALILDSDEVELVEMQPEVELPHGAGPHRAGEVAPDEACGRVDVPGETGDGGLVRVELTGLVL